MHLEDARGKDPLHKLPLRLSSHIIGRMVWAGSKAKVKQWS